MNAGSNLTLTLVSQHYCFGSLSFNLIVKKEFLPECQRLKRTSGKVSVKV